MSRIGALATRLLVAGVVAGALLAGSRAPAAEAAQITVAVGDFWFCNASFQNGVCATKIEVGDTVVWSFLNTIEPHTTTHCGASCSTPTPTPLWSSPLLTSGTFQFTFTQPGSYLYFCQVHPFSMRGVIQVNGVVGGVAEVPEVAAAPPAAADGRSTPAPAVLAGAAGAAAMGLLALGAVAFRRLRRG